MISTNFQIWRKENPFIENDLYFPDGQDCNWCRICAKWYEKKENGSSLTHLFAFTLHLKSGDIYLDCSTRKIWAKCIALTLSQPIFGLVKTVYHLMLPLSLPVAVFLAVQEGIKEQQSASKIFRASLVKMTNSLADILRTPLYTTAITIVALTGAIIGPFSPNKLYDLRALAGRLESALNRGKKDFWTFALCFQPLDNLMTIHLRDWEHQNTIYEEEPTLKGLNNLSSGHVRRLRQSRNCFDNYGRLYPDHLPYISPVIQSISF